MSADGKIRIVVGVDFTELGDHALDEAIRYAVPIENDEIHAVTVVPERSTRQVEKSSQEMAEAAQKLRARVVDRCEAVGHAWEQEFVFHVRLGEPAEALHQAAVDVDADLIVVGTHGRRGLAKMVIKSVAQTLVETAHVPVMVARPKQLSDLPKSDEVDPPRPGEDLEDDSHRFSERMSFGKRGGHIGGLL